MRGVKKGGGGEEEMRERKNAREERRKISVCASRDDDYNILQSLLDLEE